MHRFCVGLTAATFILIVAGGLVTSTDSGLSVPDWPLSYGSLFPPMVGGIRFEHTHRVIAGIIGLLTLVLAIFFQIKEKRRWVKNLALAALGAVVLQAVLGGLTVIYLLPKPISIAHATLGQTFFSLLALLALFTSSEWKLSQGVTSAVSRSTKRLWLITSVFIYLQLIVGATVRHVGGAWVPLHILLAFLICLHTLLIMVRVPKDVAISELFGKPTIFLGMLVLIQIFLGIGAFIFVLVMEKAPAPRFYEVILATAHQATGALILMTAIVSAARAQRLLKNA